MDWKKIEKCAHLAAIGAFLLGVVWFAYTIWVGRQPTQTNQPAPSFFEGVTMTKWLPSLIIGGCLLVASILYLVTVFVSRRKKDKTDNEPVANQHEACERTIGNLKSKVRRLEERDETWAIQVAARDGQIASLQEQYDQTKRLRDIADEHAAAMRDLVCVEGSVSNSHQLVGDDPYIDFQFEVTNRCVYEISLIDELTGSISFGNKRLSRAPKLEPHGVRNLKLNGVAWFQISQPLTLKEAAEILSDIPGQFHLHGLHARIIGDLDLLESDGLIEPADLIWGTGPMISKQFINDNYPKLEIQIESAKVETYFRWAVSIGERESPEEKLGSLVTLKVKLKNPRPLKVRHFKLITSEPVTLAITGEIREQRYLSSNGREVLRGEECFPNLADLHIDVERNDSIEGCLQFIVKGILPERMLQSDFVVRLHVLDDSTEEHRQDVTGLEPVSL